MGSQQKLKVAGIGAGFFSQFQYEAWKRISEVELVSICDADPERAKSASEKYKVPRFYTDFREMIVKEKPDVVDVITRPDTHLSICRFAAERGSHVICQKPLAPSHEESVELVQMMKRYPTRFMVHENWRWQPWYRETKRIMSNDILGEVFSLYFRMRTGDGWAPDAYLQRQPYFREYPRLLIFETGVHFIDTFRFLFGEVSSVYADIRRLNPTIKGEDCVQLFLKFKNGVRAVWDANRFNEEEKGGFGGTFGQMRVDARKAHLNLNPDGTIRIKPLGKEAYDHSYTLNMQHFCGDCCYSLQSHFVDSLTNGTEFESHGRDYLKTLAVVEAAYQSAAVGLPVELKDPN